MACYPVILHKDPSSDYGVTVPDVPGCFSAGATPEEAAVNVVEAIACHLEGLLIDGEPIPAPRTMEQIDCSQYDPAHCWIYVEVDLSLSLNQSQEIAMPSQLT
jgi:predicted RNase H-like HicB family nuclease